MKHVNLLIKPASSLCNLRCRYCFYSDASQHRQTSNHGLMQRETAERVIRSAFDAVDSNGSVSFSFQGGEPTLAGLPFFRDFIDLEKTYVKPGVRVEHAMQTNGILINGGWSEFLRENHFLVGLSVDGWRDLHDLHRIDTGGDGTWTRVKKALNLLLKFGVETNILSVVTRASARHPKQVYQSLSSLGVQYLQFIPCLDPSCDIRGNMPYSLLPQDYGAFLCALFDEWYQDLQTGSYVSIRLFDDYAHLFMGLPAGTCSTNGRCGGYLIVESDGTVYPCDFYTLDKHRIGMVQDDIPLSDMFIRGAQILAKEQCGIPSECLDCHWNSICCGGCIRDRYEDHGVPGNYYCQAIRKFLDYSAVRFMRIADHENKLLHRLSNASISFRDEANI